MGDITTDDGGKTVSFIGHSSNYLSAGDFLLFKDATTGKNARYEITELKPAYDPPDMYSGRAKFVPRTMPQFDRDQAMLENQLLWRDE